MLENWCEEWRGTNIESIDTSFDPSEPFRKCESWEIKDLAPSPSILDTNGIWYSIYNDDLTAQTFWMKGRYTTSEVVDHPESRATELKHIEIGITRYHDKDAVDAGPFDNAIFFDTPEHMEQSGLFAPLAIMRLVDNVGYIIDRDIYE